MPALHLHPAHATHHAGPAGGSAWGQLALQERLGQPHPQSAPASSAGAGGRGPLARCGGVLRRAVPLRTVPQAGVRLRRGAAVGSSVIQCVSSSPWVCGWCGVVLAPRHCARCHKPPTLEALAHCAGGCGVRLRGRGCVPRLAGPTPRSCVVVEVTRVYFIAPLPPRCGQGACDCGRSCWSSRTKTHLPPLPTMHLRGYM